nr:hypothetical protein [Tanacetum cinerariifolium]
MIGGLMYLTEIRPNIAFATFVCDSRFELIGYSDVDLTGCLDDYKSTYEGLQFLGDKPVNWSSKKQDCTAMPTAEADLGKTLPDVIFLWKEERVHLLDLQHLHAILQELQHLKAILRDLQEMQKLNGRNATFRLHYGGVLVRGLVTEYKDFDYVNTEKEENHVCKLSFTIDLRGLGFKDEDVNGLYYRESSKTVTDG